MQHNKSTCQSECDYKWYSDILSDNNFKTVTVHKNFIPPDYMEVLTTCKAIDNDQYPSLKVDDREKVIQSTLDFTSIYLPLSEDSLIAYRTLFCSVPYWYFHKYGQIVEGDEMVILMFRAICAVQEIPDDVKHNIVVDRLTKKLGKLPDNLIVALEYSDIMVELMADYLKDRVDRCIKK